ncbi:hypothetical protein OROHE_019324 [Orobanche hederae]
MLWKDILCQIIDLGPFQKKCLQSIDIKWRQFKSDLTSEYIYGPSKGKSPCEKYGISEEDWRDFKKIREDSDCEERRGKKQELAKMIIPHYMARGGYDLVEIREMERKMKERQEASKSGGDVVIDPPSPPTRHQRWKLGHTKRRGDMSSDAAREIVEKIDDLEEQYRHGTFIPEGRHDILAAAIRRPGHHGRVRGKGFGVAIRDYFG